MPTSTDPKARAREAFDHLPTTEKTAFVIEATFATIGSALRETGQRLADVINEFDPEEMFRMDPEHEDAEPKPKPRKKAAAKTARAKKPAATKTTASRKKTNVTPPKTVKPKRAGGTGKTAGRKKKDDDS